MGSFSMQLSEELKKDLNRHIDSIIKQRERESMGSQAKISADFQADEDDRDSILMMSLDGPVEVCVDE